MLYDKRWDATPATKPADPFTLPALIAWLVTMPGDEEYNYYCAGECLLGQWVKTIDPLAEALQPRDPASPYDYRVHGKLVDLYQFDQIAVKSPETFGAALTRARKALSDQQSVALADTVRSA